MEATVGYEDACWGGEFGGRTAEYLAGDTRLLLRYNECGVSMVIFQSLNCVVDRVDELYQA